MKNTVKKLMALLLAVIMLLALAACGQKDAKDDGKVELPVADGAVIGTGATAIIVEVQGADGKSVTFTVNTPAGYRRRPSPACRIAAGRRPARRHPAHGG